MKIEPLAHQKIDPDKKLKISIKKASSNKIEEVLIKSRDYLNVSCHLCFLGGTPLIHLFCNLY